MRNVYILATLACLSATPLAHAQLSTLCGNAASLCASTGITYNNITGDPPGDPGLGSYNCLGTTPNANMFYLQIDNPGTINLTISQSSGDVDFMLWGPFSSPSAGCAAIVASLSDRCGHAVYGDRTRISRAETFYPVEGYENPSVRGCCRYVE